MANFESSPVIKPHPPQTIGTSVIHLGLSVTIQSAEERRLPLLPDLCWIWIIILLQFIITFLCLTLSPYLIQSNPTHSLEHFAPLPQVQLITRHEEFHGCTNIPVFLTYFQSRTCSGYPIAINHPLLNVGVGFSSQVPSHFPCEWIRKRSSHC